MSDAPGAKRRKTPRAEKMVSDLTTLGFVFSKTERFCLDKLWRSREDIERIKNIPQHDAVTGVAMPQWLKARRNRLTASRYGAAAAHNKYTDIRSLVMDMLWSSFTGNAATRYGNEYEDVAADIYTCHKISCYVDRKCNADQFWVEYPGLIIMYDTPWCGVSPDGIVHDGEEVGLLEIKCPFRKTLYPFIPPQYYDQIQGIMGLLKLPWCDFVVYTPDCTRIERYAFNAQYFEEHLFPAMREFYMRWFLPCRAAKRNGATRAHVKCWLDRKWAQCSNGRQSRYNDRTVGKSTLPFIV